VQQDRGDGGARDPHLLLRLRADASGSGGSVFNGFFVVFTAVLLFFNRVAGRVQGGRYLIYIGVAAQKVVGVDDFVAGSLSRAFTANWS